MSIEWSYAALSIYDQLLMPQRSKIQHAVEFACAHWDRLDRDRLKHLTGELDGLYSLKIGWEFFALLKREGELIMLVDIIPRAQVEGLSRLSKASPHGRR